jgi:hypothetical protein
MFTAQQHEAFRTLGFVRLSGAVPLDDARQMSDRIWALLEAKGIERGDCSTWPSGPVSKLHDLKKGEPTPEDYPIVREALDSVFANSGGRAPAKNWGQPLITFPNQEGPWLLPAGGWHSDHIYRRPGEISGVNVFLLVDDVQAEGGGTVVVQSSPLLFERMLLGGTKIDRLSDQNKAFPQSHQWLEGLRTRRKDRSFERNHRYMSQDSDIDGIAVRVVELTGLTGDVFLCHPSLIHSPAPNVLNRPRLMRTQRVYSTAVAEYIKNASKP